MSQHTDRIRDAIEAVETEMKRIGVWEIPEPSPEAYENMGAFGGNTLAFEQWLRYVFLPRVRELLESEGPWPEGSAVGVRAIREFDGRDEATELVTLLCRFDALFDG